MDRANSDRGEVEVDLEGIAHVLRPSFEAQVAIEAQTGRSIEQLAHAAGRGGLSINDAAVIVTECVNAHRKAHGQPANYGTTRVGHCIVETGKLIVVRRLELLLFLAATGGYSASGERRALPTTTTPSPAGPAASGD